MNTSRANQMPATAKPEIPDIRLTTPPYLVKTILTQKNQPPLALQNIRATPHKQIHMWKNSTLKEIAFMLVLAYPELLHETITLKRVFHDPQSADYKMKPVGSVGIFKKHTDDATLITASGFSIGDFLSVSIGENTTHEANGADVSRESTRTNRGSVMSRLGDKRAAPERPADGRRDSRGNIVRDERRDVNREEGRRDGDRRDGDRRDDRRVESRRDDRRGGARRDDEAFGWRSTESNKMDLSVERESFERSGMRSDAI